MIKTAEKVKVAVIENLSVKSQCTEVNKSNSREIHSALKMENQKFELKDHQEILEDLDKLENKLHSIVDFYEELGILGQRRKHLVDILKHTDQIDHGAPGTVKKQVIFNQYDFAKRSTKYSYGGKRTSKHIGEYLEKNKSVAQIYDLLGNMTSYHQELSQKISELELLKIKDTNTSQELEFDTLLEHLQTKKDEIDEKIIKFVIKDVVEGKKELFNVMSILEDDNTEMKDMICFLQRKVDYLKDIITALMLENKLLKKGERTQTEIVRTSIVDNLSVLLPVSLRTSSLDSDEPPSQFRNDSPYYPEQDDILSEERSTRDSFTLDAPLAMWNLDEASTKAHVHRIGKNFEAMEVNQMKLNMLKAYVREHGTKYVNANTLIDPSNHAMPLWHGY